MIEPSAGQAPENSFSGPVAGAERFSGARPFPTGEADDPILLLFAMAGALHTGIDTGNAVRAFLGSVAGALGMTSLAVLAAPDKGSSQRVGIPARVRKPSIHGFELMAGHGIEWDELTTLWTAAGDPAQDYHDDPCMVKVILRGRPAVFYSLPLVCDKETVGLLIMLKEGSGIDYGYNLSLLSCLASQIASVLAKQAMMDEIRDEHHVVARVYDLFRDLSVTLPEDEMVRRFLKTLHGFLDFDFAAILLEEEGRSLLRYTCKGASGEEMLSHCLGQIHSYGSGELAVEMPPLPGGLTVIRLAAPPAGESEPCVPTAEPCVPVVETGVPVVDSPAPVSEFLLPLKIEDRRAALFYLGFASAPALDNGEVKMMSIVGYHLASVIESGRLFKRNERLAFTDGVTGIPNHRMFQETLRSEFERADRYGTPLSLLLMDIDHFKNFNDNYGHRHGDHVLREMGKILIATARHVDTAARYGGEEFAVIVPGTDLAGAMAFAERIREAVEGREILHEGRPTPVTISIGVSTLSSCQGKNPTAKDPPHPAEPVVYRITSTEEMVEIADRGLYAAKEAGRNRVVAHIGPLC